MPVTLELANSLATASGAFPIEQCRQSLSAALDTLMAAMGIPGDPVVRVAVTDGPSPERPLLLTINDCPCRYPDELLLWVASYVTGAYPRPDASVSEMLADAGNDRGAQGRATADFAALAAVEIAKTDPSILFALPQAEAYATALTPFSRPGFSVGAWPPSAAWLLPVLKEVIAQRISIADHKLVASVLAEAGAGDGRSAVVEELIATLGEHVVEVHVARGDDDLIAGDDSSLAVEGFTFLREGLFVETGVEYPSFHLAIVDDLRPGSFAFKVGCLQTTPRLRVRADECMVNDTTTHVKAASVTDGHLARPTLNPATAQPACILPLSARASLDPGLTTWDGRQHLILCMAESLRRLGHCFVDIGLAKKRFRFTQSVYPAVASTVANLDYTHAQVARVLRQLVTEGIPIGNARLIFDLLIEHATVRLDERRLLERVRAGLRHVIRDKFARTTDTVVVYLLDPRVEARLAAQRWRRQTEETLCETILAAVRAEIRELRRAGPTAQTPAILTTAQARVAVRAVLAGEFPRVGVISYDDLPGDANIMPVARISIAL